MLSRFGRRRLRFGYTGCVVCASTHIDGVFFSEYHGCNGDLLCGSTAVGETVALGELADLRAERGPYMPLGEAQECHDRC